MDGSMGMAGREVHDDLEQEQRWSAADHLVTGLEAECGLTRGLSFEGAVCPVTGGPAITVTCGGVKAEGDLMPGEGFDIVPEAWRAFVDEFSRLAAGAKVVYWRKMPTICMDRASGKFYVRARVAFGGSVEGDDLGRRGRAMMEEMNFVDYSYVPRRGGRLVDARGLPVQEVRDSRRRGHLRTQEPNVGDYDLIVRRLDSLRDRLDRRDGEFRSFNAALATLGKQMSALVAAVGKLQNAAADSSNWEIKQGAALPAGPTVAQQEQDFKTLGVQVRYGSGDVRKYPPVEVSPRVTATQSAEPLVDARLVGRERAQIELLVSYYNQYENDADRENVRAILRDRFHVEILPQVIGETQWRILPVVTSGPEAVEAQRVGDEDVEATRLDGKPGEIG